MLAAAVLAPAEQLLPSPRPPLLPLLRSLSAPPNSAVLSYACPPADLCSCAESTPGTSPAGATAAACCSLSSLCFWQATVIQCRRLSARRCCASRRAAASASSCCRRSLHSRSTYCGEAWCPLLPDATWLHGAGKPDGVPPASRWEPPHLSSLSFCWLRPCIVERWNTCSAPASSCWYSSACREGLGGGWRLPWIYPSCGLMEGRGGHPRWPPAHHDHGGCQLSGSGRAPAYQAGIIRRHNALELAHMSVLVRCLGCQPLCTAPLWLGGSCCSSRRSRDVLL